MIMRAKAYSIPKELRHVHAYHPDHDKLYEFNLSNSAQVNLNLKDNMFKRQNGLCPVCDGIIDLHTIIYSYKPVIHHIVPVSEGGHPKNITNLVLLHKGCHLQTHVHKNSAD
jgi:5-methylcytosine-specific restriction endonuclease McrA